MTGLAGSVDVNVGVIKISTHTIPDPLCFSVVSLLVILPGITMTYHQFSCKGVIATSFALCVISIGIADALVMLRVSVLWGRHRAILIAVFIVFLSTYTTSVVCAVISGIQLVGVSPYSLSVTHVCQCMHGTDTVAVFPIPKKVCSTSGKPSEMAGVWIPGVSPHCYSNNYLYTVFWTVCSYIF